MHAAIAKPAEYYHEAFIFVVFMWTQKLEIKLFSSEFRVLKLSALCEGRGQYACNVDDLLQYGVLVWVPWKNFC